MSKYRKKPVIIEAFQMTEDRFWHNTDWPVWLHEAWQKGKEKMGGLWRWQNGRFAVGTLEGPMIANPGDWVIKGVKGELYPIKDEIFILTYEPANPERT